MGSKKWLGIISILLYALAAIILCYTTPRTEFIHVFSLFTLLFALYLLILRSPLSLKGMLAAAIAVRVCLLFSTPNLSDDVFRFIWDGRITANGFNTYLYTPDFLINEFSIALKGINSSLYALLNSKSYFTVYPPVAQGLFYLSAALDTENTKLSIILFKSIILLGEIGVLYFGIKLLQLVDIPKRNILIYAFNPLVIIEGIGNAHYESIMVCFLLIGFVYLHQKKIGLSAIALAISVSLKMLPLMFAPLLLRYLSFKQFIIYCSICLSVVALFFLPFYDAQIFTNLFSSVDLYFHTFEFNASIYYLIRKVGYWMYEYNIIHMVGHWLPLIVFSIFITIIFLVKKLNTQELIKWSLIFLTIYFFFATTVHPWYLISLVALCIFTRFSYPVLWSFLAILSYSGYANEPFSENLTFTFIVYLCVFGAFFYEIGAKKPLFNLLPVTPNKE